MICLVICCFQKGNTALLYAAYNNNVECVKAILEWGGDITAQNKHGHSAMDIVITLGHKHGEYITYVLAGVDTSKWGPDSGDTWLD